MKRWILLLLVCLMLAGCGTDEPTEPTESTAATQETLVTEPTEPTLLQSDVEGLSTFRLEEDACACLPVYAAATLATGDPSCDAAGLMALFQRQAAGLRVMGKAGLRVVKLA